MMMSRSAPIANPSAAPAGPPTTNPIAAQVSSVASFVRNSGDHTPDFSAVATRLPIERDRPAPIIIPYTPPVNPPMPKPNDPPDNAPRIAMSNELPKYSLMLSLSKSASSIVFIVSTAITTPVAIDTPFAHFPSDSAVPGTFAIPSFESTLEAKVVARAFIAILPTEKASTSSNTSKLSLNHPASFFATPLKPPYCFIPFVIPSLIP